MHLKMSFHTLHTRPFQEYSFESLHLYGKIIHLQEVIKSAYSQNQNVLLLGEAQSGKTHILHACTHILLGATLTSGSHLIQKLMKTLRLQETIEPASHLIIDNIHTLQRSHTAQSWLMQALQSGSTLIASCSYDDLSILTPSLRDTIKQSTVIILPKPSTEDIVQIIQHYIKLYEVTLTERELETLLCIKELSIIKTLVNLKKRKGITLTKNLLLGMGAQKKSLVAFTRIIDAVCGSQAITPERLCCTRPSRDDQVLQDLCIFLCKENGAPLDRLAQVFHKKHYSSLHSACKRASRHLTHNPHLFTVLHDIEKSLKH
ncbi:MAG: hypothetical protein OXC30_03830 [Alphaproteobacteria bacterium]|nr:hypothetical protein [Alphaproteobacteria bacterium]